MTAEDLIEEQRETEGKMATEKAQVGVNRPLVGLFDTANLGILLDVGSNVWGIFCKFWATLGASNHGMLLQIVGYFCGFKSCAKLAFGGVLSLVLTAFWCRV